MEIETTKEIVHTGDMWQLIVGGIILVGRIIGQYNSVDWLSIVVDKLFFVVGWGIGYLLAEADDMFYATVCSPQELTCQRVKSEMTQRNWKNAWGILKSTKGERTKLPIKNMLTAYVIAIVGVWVATSSRSVLAGGIVLSLGVRLFIDAIKERDFTKWYWVFARPFSMKEHRILMGVWGLLLAVQFFVLLRG